MDKFILKEINNVDMRTELERIGFDKSYLHKAEQKYSYKNLKIYDLSIPQANILKQTAISFGADCAVHREVITSKVEKSDCILGGSFSQLSKIVQKLRSQPFSLKNLADLIEANLSFELEPLSIKGQIFDFKQPYIVGVLNLTIDSFSDGGEFFEFRSASEHLIEMIEEGTAISDATKMAVVLKQVESQVN